MSIATRAQPLPTITLLVDDDAKRSDLGRLVNAMSFHLLADGPVRDIEDDLPLGDVVLADAGHCMTTGLSSLEERVGTTRQLVVRVVTNNLDEAFAACPTADIVIGEDETELRLALAAAGARVSGVSAGWSDVASDEGLRLQHLADEIARIARTLIDLPQGLVAGDALSDGQTDYRAGPVDDGGDVTAAEVRRIIRLRRLRERFFAPELFADPAWDMLLDLAAARIERSRVAVSSLCIAASVPPTTALRWIKAMTDRGLLRRTADAHDARRIFIQLSDDAAAAMDKYLRAARANGGLAV